MKKYKVMLAAGVMTVASASVYAQIRENSYAIVNVVTGKVLRIKDANGQDGTPIVSYSAVNWKCVTWDFQQTKDGAYRLKSLFSEKTLGPSSDGKTLEEQTVANSSEEQVYEFIPAGNDTYFIKQRKKGLFVTPADENGTVDEPVLLQAKKNSDIQKWKLREQHPTM
ncbi:RICIN domain-containing protein [Chitinophaga filiformis]|uniref:Ricin-type beta-trefoil lectin domain-like n=1 Tax=Chitinophaga filiformis TaxID=104663 RepID=A0A1G7NUU9_CHIFI|nr:RICIN domain-containing protein [Chitinophaga filiformis]SDF77878.1 Ricin-type beta-trefoil lectin domain-like [Chitinophaga filiformis]